MRRPVLRILAGAACVTGLMAPAGPRAADPQPYGITITPTGIAPLDSALQASSTLVSLRTIAPVGPFALIGRAQDDAARFATALHSFGYYDGQVQMRIAGRAPGDPGLVQALDQAPAGAAVAVVATMQLGQLFHLRHVTIDGAVPADVRARLAPVAPGAPAVAADVLAAQQRLLSQLRDDGYALARVDAPLAVETPGEHVLDITYKVTAGPRVDLGPIALNGQGDVHEGFIRRRLLVHQGEQFNPDKIEAARQDLASTGVFSSVRVGLPDHVDAQGQLPVAFDFTDRPPHTVSFTAAYSTDLGASVGATWTHRNLVGNAEQLNLSAAATELGGSASTQPGYELGAQLIKPDYLRRDQTLELDVKAFKEDLEAYNRTGGSAGVTLSRKLSPHWTASVGLAAVQEKVEQEDVTRDYTLLQAPLVAKYDDSDSLFEPTKGVRAAFTATPTEALGGRNASFALLQASASTYLDLALLGATPGRSVIALRGLVGSAQGASQFELPPDQRFYAGGSTTVRGYKYQSVGPLFADHNPQGGTAIDAGTVEFRQRIGASFGAVGFVDAGQVSTASAPFGGQMRVGAGAGVRYFTSIGPIRLDVAVPLSKQPGGDTLELYIGLGEAF
jgi:translocation and assembly module TamA